MPALNHASAFSYRIPAIISAVLVLVAALALFLWAFVKTVDGIGNLQGSQLAWVMVRCINSGIGGWAGGILYQSGARSIIGQRSLTRRALLDFSRYAVHPGDQMYGQIFSTPLCLLGSGILGIVVTSCARGFYPNEPLLWKLYDLLQAIQRNEAPVARAAASKYDLLDRNLRSMAQVVAGGMDLAALCPHYIEIRRGSLVIVTANSFISAISGYAVFLGPHTGIIFVSSRLSIPEPSCLNDEFHIKAYDLSLRHRRIKLSHPWK
ncbi:hypothetical protein EDD22DRAFT_959288 [Suillus occidentalis]|nr:hypothetical protein EDD22DRAFT_959288 [Suillus occidentalis]